MKNRLTREEEKRLSSAGYSYADIDKIQELFYPSKSVGEKALDIGKGAANTFTHGTQEVLGDVAGVLEGYGVRSPFQATSANQEFDEAMKTSNENWQRTIDQLHQARKEGRDTKPYFDTLKSLQSPDYEEINPTTKKTNKQILGDFTQAGTEVVGAMTLGTGSLVGTGARALATEGAAFAGTMSAGNAMSEGKDLQGVLTDTAIGTAGGAVGGAVLGNMSRLRPRLGTTSQVFGKTAGGIGRGVSRGANGMTDWMIDRFPNKVSNTLRGVKGLGSDVVGVTSRAVQKGAKKVVERGQYGKVAGIEMGQRLEQATANLQKAGVSKKAIKELFNVDKEHLPTILNKIEKLAQEKGGSVKSAFGEIIHDTHYQTVKGARKKAWDKVEKLIAKKAKNPLPVGKEVTQMINELKTKVIGNPEKGAVSQIASDVRKTFQNIIEHDLAPLQEKLANGHKITVEDYHNLSRKLNSIERNMQLEGKQHSMMRFSGEKKDMDVFAYLKSKIQPRLEKAVGKKYVKNSKIYGELRRTEKFADKYLFGLNDDKKKKLASGLINSSSLKEHADMVSKSFWGNSKNAGFNKDAVRRLEEAYAKLTGKKTDMVNFSKLVNQLDEELGVVAPNSLGGQLTAVKRAPGVGRELALVGDITNSVGRWGSMSEPEKAKAIQEWIKVLQKDGFSKKEAISVVKQQVNIAKKLHRAKHGANMIPSKITSYGKQN